MNKLAKTLNLLYTLITNSNIITKNNKSYIFIEVKMITKT